MKRNLKIALLYGGKWDEAEISRLTGAEVAKSLERLGYNFTPIDVKEDIATVLEKTKPDLIFNALTGPYTEDGCIQGLFEIMGIRYTHSGVLTSAICMHKPTAKRIMQMLDIPTPRWSEDENLEYPYMLKPVNNGSSVGTSLIFDEKTTYKSQKDITQKMEFFIEQFIPGAELSSVVIRNKAIGTCQITPLETKFCTYESKYTQNKEIMTIPADIPKDIYNKTMEYSLQIYQFLKCKGAIRADFIYSGEKLYMLEINTQPGLTQLSILPKVAQKCANMSIDDVIESIIMDAMQSP